MTEPIIKSLYDQSNDPTFSSRLVDIFDKDSEAMNKYIQVGRKFYQFVDKEWKLLTITYVRSGVFFFKYEGNPIEHHGIFNSVAIDWLHVADIYIDDITAFYLNRFKGLTKGDIRKRLLEAKWEDYQGNLKFQLHYTLKSREL